MADYNRRNGTYIQQVPELPLVHSIVGRNHTAEMAYVKPLSPHDTLGDPEYWLNTEEGQFVQFSNIGLINRYMKKVMGNWELVLERNHYDYFSKAGRKLSKSRVVGIIDEIYKRISTLEFDDPEEARLFSWDAQEIIARFDDYRDVVHSESDIIAKKSDRMVIVKISDKCDRKCLYCTEPAKGGIKLYPLELIKHNMGMVKALQQRYHPGFGHLFTEGFLNTADINYFFLKGGTDPARIVEQLYANFPQLQKVYTFMGVPTVLDALQRDPNYLRRLWDSGLNRILIGFETGDNITSRFVGKNETAKQKKEAAHAVMDHGFKLSVILQWGMVGKGFWHTTKAKKRAFRPNHKIVENTKKLIAETLEDTVSSGTKSRPQVILSKHIPAAGTRLQKMFEKGICVPYADESKAVWEKRAYEQFCAKHGIDIELGYETALEGRVRAG